MGESSVVALALVVVTLVLHQIRVECYYQNNVIYQGKWVEGPYGLPYYTDNCPFLRTEFNCLKNGRPDNQCKKWTSLACMIHAAVPGSRYTNTKVGSLSTITFTDYNLSLLLSGSAFFVDIITNARGKRVMKLNSISNGQLWKTADILIFDSWHWWLHSGRKQAWDFIDDGRSIVRDMDRLVLYEKALRSWARWVEINVNPVKTKIFFQGVSPDHDNGRRWGVQGQTCAGQVLPFFGSKYPEGPTAGEPVLERVLRSMSKPVYLLDISYLSQLRKDGHPSIYGFGGRRFSDCTHWCLPGVPDVWNELFYAALLKA